MRKAIKKVGLVVTMVGLMTTSLVGCSKKTECENCGETKTCNKYEMSVLGETEEGWLCDDCVEELKPMVEMLGGTMKKK